MPTPPSLLHAESAREQPVAPPKPRGRLRAFAPAAALVAIALAVTGMAYVVRADPTAVATPAYDEFADPDAPPVTTPPLPADGEPGIPLADGATASTIARLEAATTTTSSPSELALLARLLLQQAAVTGDAETYNRAVAALDRAVAQAPGDLAVRAQRAAARSTVHDFNGALKDAEAVLAVNADDPGALGAAYDAAFETGRYQKAEKDLTALMALRPDAPQVLIRQARWVALHGDPATAATLVGRARTAADQDGVVGTARASYELIAGKLALDEGRYDLAEAAYRNALVQAPGWHAALAGLGRTLAATGDLTGAEAALTQAGDTVPLPDTLSALGDVRTLLGDADGAAAAYGTVDVVATLESSAQLFNRAVILSRADRGVRTAAAVRDARAELTMRTDVYGYDALGWALLAHGEPKQAARAADRSLVLGTRDPRLLAHAGLAHAAAGHPVRAGTAAVRGGLAEPRGGPGAHEPGSRRPGLSSERSRRMNRRQLAVLVGVTAGLAGASVAVAPAAQAHPLGNFTRNTYVSLTISPDTITAQHVLDLAEVPTFQERRTMDTDGDGAVSSAEASAWGAARCATTSQQIVATTPQGALSWTVVKSEVTFPQGQGGLPTTRLECALTSPSGSATSLELAVGVEQGRVGWHEVTAVGDGVTLTSDVPTTSASQRLTAYPVGVSPIDLDRASLTWAAGPGAGAGAADEGSVDEGSVDEGSGNGNSNRKGAAAAEGTAAAPDGLTALAPRGLDGATQAFTNLVGAHQVTLGFGLLALAISLALGGLHALAPGHGKTLMAASLIGTEGRRRDALVLGASVTTAHTAGVVVLALALSLSSTIAPETAYPWLGLASATLAVGVGVSLFRQARRGGGLNRLHGHTHGPGGHTHGPGGHSHRPDHDHPPTVSSLSSSGLALSTARAPMLVAAPTHEHPHPHVHATAETEPVALHGSRAPTRRIVALGLAGGLVPSPSAIVVLLAGFALGRSWFALLLVVAYGLGMAFTLTMIGVVVVRAGGLTRRVAAGGMVPRPVLAVLTRLPLVAAVVVMSAGAWLGVRSFLAL